MLFVVDSESFALEYSFVINIAEEDIWSNIIVGMLIDVFEYGWIQKGDDILRFDIWKLFVVFDLIFFVEAETIETAKIGGD